MPLDTRFPFLFLSNLSAFHVYNAEEGWDMLECLLTDRRIIRRVLRGNKDSFRLLVDRYGAMVYGVAYARVNNAADAEEISQETFVRLFQWLDRLNNKSAVGSWLVQVARSVAIDLLRQRSRETPLEQAQDAVPSICPNPAREELRRLVLEEMTSLDPDERECLLLYYFRGRRARDLAALLGITPEAASKRLQRARAALGRRLEDRVGDDLVSCKQDPTRTRRIMRAILAVPTAWNPSSALPAAGLAVAGASSAKLLSAIGIIVVIAMVALFGWREIRRPYRTQHLPQANTVIAQEDLPSVSNPPPPATSTQTSTSPPATDGNASPVAVLQPGMKVTGIVLDSGLRHVSGATVTLDNKRVAEWPNFPGPLVDLVQQTDSSGRFAFPHAPFVKGAYTQMYISAKGPSGFIQKRFYQQGERDLYFELVLEPCGSLKGRVVNASGVGIADGSIEFRRYLSGKGDTSAAAKTAPDGSFSVPSILGGVYEVTIDARGYIPYYGKETLVNSAQELRFQLDAGSFIAGRVVDDATGEPISGLSIRANMASCRNSATSDESGQFKIAGLTPGFYTVGLTSEKKSNSPYVAVSPINVDLPENKPVLGVEVRATFGATVSGRVLEQDSGESIPDADIRFNSVGVSGYGGSAISDQNGCYQVARLIKGTYNVMVVGDREHFETKFTLPTQADMTGVDFRIVRDAIKGIVLNADNTPVAGAAVAAIRKDFWISHTTTDDNGRFRIFLEKNRHTPHLQAYGERCASRLTAAHPGSECILRLMAGGRIEGTVEDTDGNPIADEIVTAVPDDDSLNCLVTPEGVTYDPTLKLEGTRASTSATGAFQLEPVLSGDYSINVYFTSSVPGYPVATTQCTVRAGEVVQLRLVVDVSQFAVIEGMVTKGGEPVPEGFVKVNSSSKDWIWDVFAYADFQGRYRIDRVRPGTVTMTSALETNKHSPERSRQSKTVEVAEGETKTVDFDFPVEQCVVEGTVTMNGEPLACVLTFLPAGAADDSAKVEVDTPSGQYSQTLKEGTYEVKISDVFTGMAFAWASVEAVQGQVTRQDFNLSSGIVEGLVSGLREGEKAAVAALPVEVDLNALLADPAQFASLASAYAEVEPGKPFRFDKLMPGVYNLGAIPAPAAEKVEPSTLLDAMRSGRYILIQIEVKANTITPADLALP